MDLFDLSKLQDCVSRSDFRDFAMSQTRTLIVRILNLYSYMDMHFTLKDLAAAIHIDYSNLSRLMCKKYACSFVVFLQLLNFYNLVNNSYADYLKSLPEELPF